MHQLQDYGSAQASRSWIRLRTRARLPRRGFASRFSWRSFDHPRLAVAVLLFHFALLSGSPVYPHRPPFFQSPIPRRLHSRPFF